MAQRDYVARGQKKRAPNKKTKAAPVPWFRIVLAILLIALFAYGLWWLTQSSQAVPEPVEASPKMQVVDVKPEQTDEDPLPVLEEEQWEFIEALPNYSVEVDVTEQQVSERRYLMQCGSFRKKEQAETLKAQIAFQGLASQVLESNGRNGLWHRVVLGPFDRKRDAERDRHQLRRGNINNCKIWFWD